MATKSIKFSVTFLNLETMTEEPGKFIKYVAPFKALIKSDRTGETLVLDLDDFWAI